MSVPRWLMKMSHDGFGLDGGIRDTGRRIWVDEVRALETIERCMASYLIALLRNMQNVVK